MLHLVVMIKYKYSSIHCKAIKQPIMKNLLRQSATQLHNVFHATELGCYKRHHILMSGPDPVTILHINPIRSILILSSHIFKFSIAFVDIFLNFLEDLRIRWKDDFKV